MSTFIFIASCAAFLLIVFSRIPGLEHFVKPFVEMLFKVLAAGAVNLCAWGIYVFKTLMVSHVELVRHLLLPPEKIDPSTGMREEWEK